MLLDFLGVCLGGAGGVREERVGVKPVVSSQCDNGELSVVKKKRKEKKKRPVSGWLKQSDADQDDLERHIVFEKGEKNSF